MDLISLAPKASAVEAYNMLADAFLPAGGYISITKSVLAILVLLLWTRLLTWADKDADAAHLPRITLNIANLCGVVVAYALFFWLPTFILSFFVLIVGFGAEVGVYLTMRKKVVGLHDLKGQWEAFLKSWTKKRSPPEGPELVAITGSDNTPIVRPLKEAPERPAYDAIQATLADPLRKKADQVDISPASGGLSSKFIVDGVSYPGAAIDPEAGAAAIARLKAAAGLNVAERRKPQKGTLKALADGRKLVIEVQTAGSTAGEYMRLIVDPKKRRTLPLDKLGLPQRYLDLVKQAIQDKTGVVLVAAPKGQGMTSMLYAILRAHDVFIEHIHSVEREPEQELEGITQNKLPASATPDDEAKAVDWCISQEPDVIAMTRLDSPKSAAALSAFAEGGKMAYVAIRAGSAVEAIAQWQKLAGPKALDHLKLVISGRIVRKLCMACKEGYAPDPGTLRKLGMDPARVSQLFKAREVPLRDAKTNQPIPCDFCRDMRFNGQTGVFEVLQVTDEARAALSEDFAKAGAAGGMFKSAFRKQGGKYLQEEALAVVERGDTSVQEVLRVLRGDTKATTPAANPTAPTGKPAAPRSPAAAPRSPAR